MIQLESMLDSRLRVEAEFRPDTAEMYKGEKIPFVTKSTHPSYVRGIRFHYGFLSAALEDGYDVLLRNPKPAGAIVVEVTPDRLLPQLLVPKIVIESEHPNFKSRQKFDHNNLVKSLEEGYSVLLLQPRNG